MNNLSVVNHFNRSTKIINNMNTCRYCDKPTDNQCITICACQPVHPNCRATIKNLTKKRKLISNYKCDTCHKQYLDNDINNCKHCLKENDETSILVCACGPEHVDCRSIFIKYAMDNSDSTDYTNLERCPICDYEYQDLLLTNNILKTGQLKKTLLLDLSMVFLFMALSIAMVILTIMKHPLFILAIFYSITITIMFIIFAIIDLLRLKKINISTKTLTQQDNGNIILTTYI